MEDFNQIENAITNVLTGNASDHDRKMVSDWAGKSAANKYTLEQLRKIWREDTPERKSLHSDHMKRSVWDAGVGKADQYISKSRTRTKHLMRTWLRIAAVLAIIGAIGVVIPRIKHAWVANQGSAKSPGMIVKSNPAGQKSKIFLPDGSIVWLNAESSIWYRENFSGSVREVGLSGEAYFEVKHDALSPFVVKTRDFNVRVLGTKFNVDDFDGANAASVALAEGAVEVASKDGAMVERLNQSGQGISYPHGSDIQKAQRFEFDFNGQSNRYMGWKDGILVFDGDNFGSFLSKIKRWYGVEVDVRGNPPEDWSIRAEFKDEYLSNILTSVSFNKKFEYKLDRKKLTLMFH